VSEPEAQWQVEKLRAGDCSMALSGFGLALNQANKAQIAKDRPCWKFAAIAVGSAHNAGLNG
jgi:hypothetical protein